ARERLGSARPHVSPVVVVMRPNLDQLADLVRWAAGWKMEDVFVQHLAHDFGEESLPEQYRPMREWVNAQTLLHEDPRRVAARFAEARAVAAELGVTLRLPT